MAKILAVSGSTVLLKLLGDLAALKQLENQRKMHLAENKSWRYFFPPSCQHALNCLDSHSNFYFYDGFINAYEHAADLESTMRMAVSFA